MGINDLRLILTITKTNLVSRPRQTIVAALGVTFGIASYIIMMGFMTGLNDLLDGLILNRTPHVALFNEVKPSELQPSERYFRDEFNVIRSVKPRQNQKRIHNALPIIAELEANEAVKGVTAQTSSQVFYIAGSTEMNGQVTGIEVEKEVAFYNFHEYIVAGDYEDLLKINNGILLGKGIAEVMSLSVGNRIQVTTANGGVFPLKIVGFYQSGLADIDKIQSFVSIGTAQQLLGAGNSYITDINIKLHDKEQAVEFANACRELYDVSALDIDAANAQFDTGSSIRTLISYAVSITLLIVAGFGIYNILNMLIYEKINDIAILKATGFSAQDVQLIFISQALIIGIIGGAMGLLLGYGVSVLIDHTPFDTDALPTIDTYPVNFDAMYYIIAVIFALVSTFLAGYLPSLKAAHVDPVEIIRGN